MTLKEFKLWFEGFVAGCDGNGISAEALDSIVKAVESIEEPMIGKAIPQHPPGTVVWEPCKTVPLGSTMTFDPSVVYNNGAAGVSSTGKSTSGAT